MTSSTDIEMTGTDLTSTEADRLRAANDVDPDAAHKSWGSASGPSNEMHLRFKSDWGTANFFTVCGWLAAGLTWRSAPSSTFVVHTGRGYKDNVDAVIEYKVDIAITSPIATVAQAYTGIGMYETPHPELRAIGILPHADRLLFGIATEVADRYGIHSYADLAAKQPPIKLVTALDDGVQHAGFAARRILECYGISRHDVVGWGGSWTEREWPRALPGMVASGECDAIFNEAIIGWHTLAETRPMRFLSIDDWVLTDLRERYLYQPATVPAGYFHGLDADVVTLDWADWLIVTRADLSDTIARALVDVLIDERHQLEAKYRHVPPTRSGLTYPIDLDRIWRTAPVPLHEAAAQRYRERGVAGPEGG